MRSIRVKLFVGILLILSVFLSGILSYGLFFKKYFQNQKLSEMESVILEVEDGINRQGLDNLSERVSEIAESFNVQIEVTSNNTGKALCSTHNINKGNGMGGVNRFEVIKDIGTENGVSKVILYDKSTGVEFLTAKGNVVGEAYEVTVKTPINIMDDAVNNSISFLLKIFTPIIIVILVLTYIFSNRFTRPIIKIKEKTEKITKLNFTEDLMVSGRDEIADLTSSVNNLSNTIKVTLEELESKNKSLEDMIEKERENERVRREFVSSVSHELKSPIAVISGYAQMLEADIISNKEDKDYYIKVINEETERMSVIVSDLLELYKLQSNTFSLKVSEIYLGDLVKNIIRKNKIAFDKIGVNLETTIENPIVIGDEIRLEQAIQNYINNSLSHIDSKKLLKIEVSSDGKISVFNSGENINESDLEKIWQGFVRVDKVRNYKEKRIGLGLTIVNQIAKLHEGSCGVLNKESGVEFWIKVNVAKC